MSKLIKRILVFTEDENGKQSVRKVEIYDDKQLFGEVEATAKDKADMNKIGEKQVKK